MNESDIEYAGFWVRAGASIIDTLLVMVITYPLLISIYGWKYFDSEKAIVGPANFLITWVFPIVAVVWFWSKKQATPGKAALSLVFWMLTQERASQLVKASGAILDILCQ